MTIDKQALRERYSPKPVPKCHICGEEMTIQQMSASRITYGCTGATYDDKGCHYAEGRSIADDHYEQSRVTVVDVSDPDVLALLDELDKKQQYIKLRDQENEDIALTVGKLRVELEHYKSREERVTKLVLDNSTSWDVLYEKLEAAEKRIAEQREYYEGVIADGSKRIAELEAKLETADKLQDSAFRDGLKAGFSYGQTDDQSGFAQCMSAYSTRAGIGVKQQEDSVDSDVGRNQPGMVVAVHIDAGDFVKVKGQVFEVEETDFDDHDVTLWFVGGNALKCAAGCPVEVVSAPVAAGIKVKGE
ncbi:ead/Ea22-like family protein [Salmonella enterica]|uniref:ead/Ea22-like family protein n=1 Tax=Salmonella enterica TaxID=28901 RepID=UPI0009AD7A95|nr:ead/Ea22-like family protein [Salmonella enterica]EDU6941286.1 ead/Ea22-like family protein [Salmonella enterica subsp. enterica serovar 4,[5],12:b:-]EEA6887247.1 ead/Ea22-like family protein [Salmonella enterica subsp. enterica serovar Hartford]EAM8315007.1 ead/Ea22-like family protein [Salmonella enterica]EAN5437253.1 ead/Ea22-like family protein [Salmonella enterica]EAR5886808.1 ead/Ea22-like family protein [Salmonella enterica]